MDRLKTWLNKTLLDEVFRFIRFYFLLLTFMVAIVMVGVLIFIVGNLSTQLFIFLSSLDVFRI